MSKKTIIPWEEYVQPHRLYGDLCFVGSRSGSTHLLPSDDGLILIDSGMPDTLYHLLENIRALGYNPRDIRHIIHSHGHYDHMGATRALIELYHPVTYLGAPDLDYVTGKRDLSFADYFGKAFTEAFVPDVLINDGDVLEIGGRSFEFIMTSGHTEGTLSVFFEVDGELGVKRAAMFGGAGMNSLERDFLLSHDLPLSLRDDFLNGIERLRRERVDIHIGNHVRQNRMDEKLARRAAGEKYVFVDSDEWLDYLGRVRRTFDRMLATEAATERKET